MKAVCLELHGADKGFGQEGGVCPRHIAGLFLINLAIQYRLSPFITSWLLNVWRYSRQVEAGPAAGTPRPCGRAYRSPWGMPRS